MRLLVLRPEPGATATAKRARELGLDPIVAPLFEVRPRAWTMPEEPVDAVMLTSANAARALGTAPPELAAFLAYAVGAKTAAAARAAGFTDIRTGEAGVAELARQAVADGMATMLHLAGEDRTAFEAGPLQIVTRIVYAAEAVDPPPPLPEGDAVALLHSARGARRFAALVDPAGFTIAAISPAVAEAAGAGWSRIAVAGRPDDDALLAVAARLCQEERA